MLYYCILIVLRFIMYNVERNIQSNERFKEYENYCLGIIILSTRDSEY